VDAHNAITLQGVLHNLSETGLYMNLPFCLEAGTRMDFFIGFYADKVMNKIGVHVYAKCFVLRATPRTDDSCDAAVKFEEPILLS